MNCFNCVHSTLIIIIREEIYRLKSQLHESEDGGAEKDVEIARLKSDLSHWKLKATKSAQDIQAFEAEQRKANAEIQVVF